MDTKDLLGNNRCDREAVEDVVHLPPELDGVPALALVVKAVDTIDRGTFVVATQQEELQRVFDLETQQQGHTLYTLETSIYVVAVVVTPQAIHTYNAMQGIRSGTTQTCVRAYPTNTSSIASQHILQAGR